MRALKQAEVCVPGEEHSVSNIAITVKGRSENAYVPLRGLGPAAATKLIVRAAQSGLDVKEWRRAAIVETIR